AQTDTLFLRYDDQIISLQFTTGELLQADKVKYAYKLDGFNNQWITIRENKVTFSSLPPGNYNLLIKASNSDGIWNEKASAMSIVVQPPFYWTTWAIMS